MIDHLGIPVRDWGKARAFYDAALGALGGRMLMEMPEAGGYGREAPVFWIHGDAKAAGSRHIAFSARSRAEVDAFHAAALAAGGRDNGKPGLRPHYHASYYAAFVFDPDGNNVEAVTHLPE